MLSNAANFWHFFWLLVRLINHHFWWTLTFCLWILRIVEYSHCSFHRNVNGCKALACGMFMTKSIRNLGYVFINSVELIVVYISWAKALHSLLKSRSKSFRNHPKIWFRCRFDYKLPIILLIIQVMLKKNTPCTRCCCFCCCCFSSIACISKSKHTGSSKTRPQNNNGVHGLIFWLCLRHCANWKRTHVGSL